MVLATITITPQVVTVSRFFWADCIGLKTSGAISIVCNYLVFYIVNTPSPEGRAESLGNTISMMYFIISRTRVLVDLPRYSPKTEYKRATPDVMI